jgi:hypothetical protein
MRAYGSYMVAAKLPKRYLGAVTVMAGMHDRRRQGTAG